MILVCRRQLRWNVNHYDKDCQYGYPDTSVPTGDGFVSTESMRTDKEKPSFPYDGETPIALLDLGYCYRPSRLTSTQN